MQSSEDTINGSRYKLPLNSESDQKTLQSRLCRVLLQTVLDSLLILVLLSKPSAIAVWMLEDFQHANTHTLSSEVITKN